MIRKKRDNWKKILSWGVIIVLLVSVVVVYGVLSDFDTQTVFADTFLLKSFVNTLESANALDVFVVDHYAYIVTKENPGTDPEFYIYDIGNPASPVLMGSLNIGVAANQVYVEGQRAYLMTNKNNQELMILDVASKNAPRLIGSYDVPGSANGMAVKALGTTVYFSVKESGAGPEFYILDVYNATSPILRATYEVGANVNDLDVVGDYIVLGTSHPSQEVVVLNAVNAATPSLSLLSVYDVLGASAINGVSYYAGKLYGVGDDNGSAADFFAWHFPVGTGAGIFPSTLNLVGSLNLGVTGVGVTLYGDRIYVAGDSSSKSLITLKLSGTTPMITGIYSAGDNAHAVALRQSLVYLATNHNDRELQILDPGTNFEITLADYNQDGQIVVSCLGDSNTKRQQLPESWCDIVGSRLGAGPSSSTWRVVNRGVPGATMSEIANWPDAFEQMSSTLAVDRPDHLIMMFGTNDVTFLFNISRSFGVIPRFFDLEPSIDAARVLIALAQNGGVQHIFLNLVPPRDETVDRKQLIELTGHFLNRLRQEFPQQFIIDTHSPLIVPGDIEGGVHITAPAHQKVADRVTDKLQ